MNKLSLVGMQLLYVEIYKESFDVSSESPYIFSGSSIRTNESLFI
jgi:hypothetical protein